MSSSTLRLPWIDHLRTLVIVLVVHMHACVTYSHVGDWYWKAPPEPSLTAKIPFIVWQGHLQAFFMGLLFFISGYFAHGALRRRGPAAFLGERAWRLGLPALFYMLAIHPFILLGLNPWEAKFPPPLKFFQKYISSGQFLNSSGPLWFAVALLIFCAALALGRAVAQRGRSGEPVMEDATRSKVEGRNTRAPSAGLMWLCAVALGIGTFAVRLVQPVGASVLNLQLCFFVQYAAFFIAGLHAARHGWLLTLAASQRARTAGWLALAGGPLGLLVLFFFGGRAAPIDAFFGGWHWQAFGFAMWEQLAGVGLSLGLLAWFARKADADRPWARWLAERSFGVYVLHAPVLVALAILFRGLPHHLYGLVALLTAIGVAASFAAADLVRRVPLLREIF